jgi:hypothetical protein
MFFFTVHPLSVSIQSVFFSHRCPPMHQVPHLPPSHPFLPKLVYSTLSRYALFFRSTHSFCLYSPTPFAYVWHSNSIFPSSFFIFIFFQISSLFLLLFENFPPNYIGRYPPLSREGGHADFLNIQPWSVTHKGRIILLCSASPWNHH